MNNLFKQYPFVFPLILIINLLFNSISMVKNPVIKTIIHLQLPYLNNFSTSPWFVAMGVLAIIAMILSLFYHEFYVQEPKLKRLYGQQVKGLVTLALILQTMWLLSWQTQSVLLALIFIALSTNLMLKTVRIISQNTTLRQKRWQMKYPVGLLTGWLLFETVVNLYQYMVSVGLPITIHWIWQFLMVITFIILALFAAYYYAQYGNGAVMIAVIIGTISIAIQHQSVQYLYANQVIRISASIITVIMIGLFAYLSYLKYQQTRQNKK